MRASSFAGSLVFAVIAALAAVPWMMAVSPFVGPSWALGLFSLGVAVVYLVWIAPGWPRGFAAGGLAALFALGVACLAPMPVGGVMGAVGILAVARSGFLYSGKPARAFVVEGVLVGVGLLFARALGGPSFLSLGLAFWGFFLVQSVFFLVGGIAERPADEPGVDPFEEARRRAMRLMEEVP